MKILFIIMENNEEIDYIYNINLKEIKKYIIMTSIMLILTIIFIISLIYCLI